MGDNFDLARFVIAQDEGGCYDRATAELRSGHKSSHWMWFIFPQVAGLGQSEMSRRYAISSLDEAGAYLRHQILGPRLLDCAAIVQDTRGKTAEDIFGSIDAQKLHSCMTLFMRAAPYNTLFAQVLDRYFAGIADTATEDRIQSG